MLKCIHRSIIRTTPHKNNKDNELNRRSLFATTRTISVTSGNVRTSFAFAVVLFELAALRTPFTSKNVYQLCDEVPGRNDCRGNGVDGLIRIASSPALMCLCVPDNDAAYPLSEEMVLKRARRYGPRHVAQAGAAPSFSKAGAPKQTCPSCNWRDLC